MFASTVPASPVAPVATPVAPLPPVNTQSPVPPGQPGGPVAPSMDPAAPQVPVVTPMATGTPGVDAVIDLAGDTDLQCGMNQDFVLFQHGSGFDLVFGFDPSDTGDTIAIEANVNGSGLASVEQIAISDTQYGALVDLGGGNGFLLDGVSLAQLDASDFTIHPEISPAPVAMPPAADPYGYGYSAAADVTPVC